MTADPPTPPTQDDLAAGRELDARVAEAIGWTFAHTEDEYDPRTPGSLTLVGVTPDKHRLSVVPAYSTDIGAAWQIVEWAEASPRGWKLTLMRSGRSLPDYVWICTFHRGHVELARVVERDVRVAICKAALQTVSA